MSNPKNPYEIRYELLSLAQEILLRKFEAEAVKEYNSKVGDPYVLATLPQNSIPPYMGATKSPSTEDIIAEAKKLNDFISNNDKYQK
jgi:hypothetical protein